jgi:hypothetical protein
MLLAQALSPELSRVTGTHVETAKCPSPRICHPFPELGSGTLAEQKRQELQLHGPGRKEGWPDQRTDKQVRQGSQII